MNQAVDQGVGRSGTPARSDPGIPKLVAELKDMVVAYFKQETLEPFKSLGRFLARGVAGGLLTSVGVIVLLVGVLRLLQSETGTVFRGTLSFVPYFATVLTGLLVVGLAARAIIARPAGRS